MAVYQSFNIFGERLMSQQQVGEAFGAATTAVCEMDKNRKLINEFCDGFESVFKWIN